MSKLNSTEVENISQRNIHAYAWFQFASSLLGWLPVFFLYFNQFVSLSEVVELGALYYLCVCIFEVPSGYFSDKFGRRQTLLLGGISFVFAYLTFLLASSFFALACGQALLALAIALMSGSDTAFLYDSLGMVERQHEYAEHEARGQKFGLIALAIGSLLGGILGMFDLRLPYLLSLAGAIWTVWLAWKFIEPDLDQKRSSQTVSFLKTLKQCVLQLKNSTLAWLFGVMVLMYCLEHIAYEFYQPYIQLLKIDWLYGNSTPLVSGLIISASMFGGSLGAIYSIRLATRFGVRGLLYIAFAIQLLIISGLSLHLSAAMLGVIVFRNFPMAMIHAPVNAEIAPRVDGHIRATYLSMQSLTARLVFSSFLFYLSKTIDTTADISWPALSSVLRIALAFGVTGVFFAIFLSLFVAKNFQANVRNDDSKGTS
ncbi:MAG: MFS transporter [Acidiferrobacterales bacterium]|nr:MFS transporter [Acidiferrobacterales bacterium]